MTPIAARRAQTAGALVATLALGAASRAWPVGCALWDKSLGDALYAVALYLVLALAWPRGGWRVRAVIAVVACAAIELFQLTEIPAALAADRRWIGWLLGTTFAWHDLACYAVGVGACALVAARRGAPNERSQV